MDKFKGMPIYELATDIYLFQWKYSSMSFEEIEDLYHLIQRKLPKEAVLIGIPDIITLQKVNIEDLKAIDSRLVKMIKELEGKTNDRS